MKDRKDLIQACIQLINAKNYLEIGCQYNQVFDSISICKVGVDPFSGGTLRMTSDEFFAVNKQPFDVIFIDGLHLHEQTQKDVYNALRILNKDGIIIIHDCYPKQKEHCQRVILDRTWNGDVYKAWLHFRTLPEIDCYLVDIDTGCGVIIKRYNTDEINIHYPITFESLNDDLMGVVKSQDIIHILTKRFNTKY